MVLRRGTEQRGTADVDLLDRVVPVHVEPPNGPLERVQVHAHEVDRLDAVRLEIGDVLGDVAPCEDASVNRWMQRHHPVSQNLGEARHLLEPRDGDPGLGEQVSGAAAGEQLEVESLQALGKGR